MKIDKEEIKKLLEAELKNLDFDKVTTPEIKRIVTPLPYNESLKFAIEFSNVVNRDMSVLESGDQNKINAFIYSIYDDISRYDELWLIATKFLNYTFKNVTI